MKIPALLLFVAISGCCCAKENLQGASFVFYKISDTSRVVLKPNITEPLVNITVCLQCYTDNHQRDSLFKLDLNSTPQFHLFQVSDYYYINIDGDQIMYKTSKENMEWRLICVSWESGTGVIHFVVNGKLFPRRVLKPGFAIISEVTAVLGQDVASAGLSYYRGEITFVGEIRKVNMWDRALHPSEMQSMYYNNCCYCNGTVIRWDSVDYEVYGDVILYKPSMKP